MRVSSFMSMENAMSRLNSGMERLQFIQSQLAVGRTAVTPSDAPADSQIAERLMRALEKSDVYAQNVSEGTSRLNMTEDGLGDVNEALVRIREIVVSMSDGSATTEMQDAEANTVAGLLEEAMRVASVDYNGKFLFGGSNTLTAAYERGAAAGVVHNGNTDELNVRVSESMRLSMNVAGQDVFGGLSDPIEANAWDTSLDRLNDGGGVAVGSIDITVAGVGNAVVDLSNARTLGEVRTALELAGLGISVSLSSDESGELDRLQLEAGGAAVTVAESGSTTANDLGILGTGTPLVGSDIGPFLDGDLDPIADIGVGGTRLSWLNGGRGVPRGEILVRYGTPGDLTSRTIDLSTADTLEDVKTTIEYETAGAVSVVLDGATQNRLVVGVAPGDQIEILEVAGNTVAEDLGIQKTAIGAFIGDDLDPAVTPLTPLASLMGGDGLDQTGLNISNQVPSGTRWQPQEADWTFVDLSSAETVQGMLTLINNAETVDGTPLYVEARLSEAGDKIEIFSRLSGGQLRIAEAQDPDTGVYGETAKDLGMVTMTTETLLSDLNDDRGIRSVTGDDMRITLNGSGASFDIDVSEMATVGDLIDRINDLAIASGLVGVPIARLDHDGTNGIVIDDPAGGGVTIEALSSSHAAADLGFESTAAGVSTMKSDDISSVVVDSIFSTMIKLRTALLAHDQAEVARIGREELEEDLDRFFSGRSIAAARMSRMDMAENRLGLEKDQTKVLLSDRIDADMAELITQMSRQQTVFQAMLQTMSSLIQPSLAQFLG